MRTAKIGSDLRLVTFGPVSRFLAFSPPWLVVHSFFFASWQSLSISLALLAITENKRLLIVYGTIFLTVEGVLENVLSYSQLYLVTEQSNIGGLALRLCTRGSVLKDAGASYPVLSPILLLVP